MSSYRIIGIHGLNNKPARQRLASWWRLALAEGLARNAGRAGLADALEFELVHWVDIMNTAPLDPDPEPYVAANGSGPLARHAGSIADGAREMAQGALDKLTAFPKVDVVTEEVMSRKTPDLHRYYSEPAIRQRLIGLFGAALDKARDERRRIMVIAHSMGSIIAFDVLAGMKRGGAPIRVDHFITIGSPLGLHEVKQRARERGFAIKVPEIVEHWTNMADRRDRIAFDSRLATDYAANAAGVAIRDVFVANGYMRPDGKANPHKIYGYLRTPEMSEIVSAFIGP